MSNVSKIFQEKTKNRKTHVNTAQVYFGSRSKISRFQTFFLQNPKVPKNVMGLNKHTQRSTPSYYLDVDNLLAHCTGPIQSTIRHVRQSMPSQNSYFQRLKIFWLKMPTPFSDSDDKICKKISI